MNQVGFSKPWCDTDFQRSVKGHVLVSDAIQFTSACVLGVVFVDTITRLEKRMFICRLL